MSLDLNKLENKLDEALSNETSESLNKFLTYKRMENDKQEMPVEWLISQVEDFIGLIPVDIINKAKEMQKERMIEFAKKFIDVVNIEDKDIEIIYNKTTEELSND